MKLLRVKASHFKYCQEQYTIDLVAKSRKSAEDKEYELQEIAPGLFVYSTAAFVGKNASGKSTAIELLDCCYSILGDFRLEGKHFSYDGVQLEITFYHEGNLYRYDVTLGASASLANQANFCDEHVYRKPYYKTNAKEIYDTEAYMELKDLGDLPDDTSVIFFVLKKKQTRAIFFDSFEDGADTYQLLFRAMKSYGIGVDILANVLRIFDENIDDLKQLDDHNYQLVFQGREKIMSDT